MKFSDADFNISKRFVYDYGTRGRCAACNRAPHETAPVENKFYCRKCLPIKFPENKTAVFEVTDGKFKCPSNNCNADQLSCAQFYIGTCCENASRWTQETLKYQRFAIAKKIYKGSRKDETKAEYDAEAADNEVEICRETLQAAITKAKNAHVALNEKKKWRRTVQKRTLFLAKEAMTEDNPDIDEDDEPASKRRRTARRRRRSDSEDVSCKICFEGFAGGDRQKAAIFPCGHQACYGCLSSLPQKLCPTCRDPFTVDKILKLFP